MPDAISLRLILSLLAVMLFSRGAMATPLLMVFVNKPPYSYLDNGVEKGFLLERTHRILKRAGVEAQFRELPPKRIFLEIQKNEMSICSFGWYKIADRETYARFSASLHQDRPQVVLASPRSIAAIRRHATLKELMSDGTLILATADGGSYGPELDWMIVSFAGRIDRSLQTELNVARKVAAQRADFMFMDQEDYDFSRETNPEFRDNGLLRIDYPDMPPGLKRHILCSRQVSDDVMQRINAAIFIELQH